PFLFAEGRARPLEIHREQMSLAIALLLVGLPAWYLHWLPDDRAARRSEADRSSKWRSFYLHAVMAVTALLALGYGARTLSLLVRAALFGSESVAPFGLELAWPARAAGASAMAFAAAATWWWHGRRSEDDRRVGLGARAGEIRRFQAYAVLFIVTLVAAVSAVLLLAGIWSATVGFVDHAFPPGFTPAPGAPPIPDRSRLLKEALGGSAPPLALAILLGTLYARRATTAARLPGSEGAAERGSTARAVFLYLVLFLAGTGALLSLAAAGQTLLSLLDPRATTFPLGPSLGGSVPPAFVLATLWLLAWLTAGREVLRSGAPGPADARRVYLYISLGVAEAVALVAAGFTLQRLLRPLLGGNPAVVQDFTTPVPYFLVFTAAWLYHHAVVRRESRAWETGSHAAARRGYSYLFYLAGVAAAAIGIAGTVGVIGSYVLADNTHRPDEIALYFTLSTLGLITSWYQWSSFRGTVEPGERAAPQRRLALSLAVLGGAGAVLVFGSGAVFRVVNAILAVQFTTGAVHDLWHLLADTAVGLVVALFHWRILRAGSRARCARRRAGAARPDPSGAGGWHATTPRGAIRRRRWPGLRNRRRRPTRGRPPPRAHRQRIGDRGSRRGRSRVSAIARLGRAPGELGGEFRSFQLGIGGGSTARTMRPLPPRDQEACSRGRTCRGARFTVMGSD
ncbi:MAG: DUF5671 domain-containing protein, partial [Chloroflexota bacterium]|nr:DUF5671 domain-containing protein [Chloroflexota bacterium]